MKRMHTDVHTCLLKVRFIEKSKLNLMAIPHERAESGI